VIASLTGNVVELTYNSAVIEVGGVGYLVNITSDTASQLLVGEKTTLKTVLVVREDSLTLFGFLGTDELTIFELLLSVSGVGPKSALSVMGELSVAEIVSAVVSEDDESFRKVSGIGAKTAKLIVLNLADKLSAFNVSKLTEGGISVVTGLTSLGWSDKDARQAVQEVYKAGQSDSETLKLALRQLGELKGKKR
jgi:holliday junction DNA helicase RuvA